MSEQEQVTKRKVTLTNGTATVEDYVRPDFLEAYVADARTRWASVEVSEEPDAGPAGYHGATYVPAGIDHPLAGQLFEATEGESGKRGGAGRGVSNFLPGSLAMFVVAQLGLTAFALTLAALIQTATQKNTLATSYGTAATHAALYSTAPGASAGTELTGGSPAYARIALTWSAASGGVITSTANFNVASGSTVAGAGVHAGSAGAYLDGSSVTSQAFASQGTYALSLTYTQT